MDYSDPAYVAAWFRAFVLTQLVEAPIYGRVGKVPWWAALVPSALTHPFVWFVFPRLREAGVSYLGMVACAEGFAWGVEAIFLGAMGLSVKRATLLSLLANASSVAAGLFLRIFGLV